MFLKNTFGPLCAVVDCFFFKTLGFHHTTCQRRRACVVFFVGVNSMHVKSNISAGWLRASCILQGRNLWKDQPGTEFFRCVEVADEIISIPTSKIDLETPDRRIDLWWWIANFMQLPFLTMWSSINHHCIFSKLFQQLSTKTNKQASKNFMCCFQGKEHFSFNSFFTNWTFFNC